MAMRGLGIYVNDEGWMVQAAKTMYGASTWRIGMQIVWRETQTQEQYYGYRGGISTKAETDRKTERIANAV